MLGRVVAAVLEPIACELCKKLEGPNHVARLLAKHELVASSVRFGK